MKSHSQYPTITNFPSLPNPHSLWEGDRGWVLVGARFLIFALLVICSTQAYAKKWTLKDCIDYALQNNITLQKSRLQMLNAQEDLLQSQAKLLPSLSFSTSQNVTYRPFVESGQSTVTNGYVQSSVDKVYYNGTYGVNANWTIWNGGQNHDQIRLNRLATQQAELDSATTANSIQEQIASLYVQILYADEAIKVNQESLNTAIKNAERGQVMFNVGKMSKADLAQLTAQQAQDQYIVVESESALQNYKRQLKELLQIANDEEFDVVIPETTDQMALETIPLLNTVYTEALSHRPEIRNAQLGIEVSDLNIKMAKASRLPSVGLTAAAGTNTTSMNDNAWTKQLKTNFDLAAGVTVSVPIFDQRQTKTAINKAQIQRESYLLDLQNQQTALYSTIENYWLQATTNQSKFIAAKESTKSAQESYYLLSEQFRMGLKNIIELMTGKELLLQAQQSELQSKYLTILNIHMLKFYQTGQLK